MTSLLLLISNVIVIPLALAVGYISDKIKAYKLLMFFSFLAVSFTTLMIWEEKKDLKLFIGYIGGTAFIVTLLLLVSLLPFNSNSRNSRV
jgi:hypothetical protein